MLIEKSAVCPGATLVGNEADITAPIDSPAKNISRYEVVHVHGPKFFSRQVFVKVAAGDTTVPLGTVTCATNSALSQTDGSTVGVLGTGEGVDVDVGDPSGVGECVTVGDSTDMVGGTTGVEGVGVAGLPRTVRLPGIKSISVRALSPLETRALHSTTVWPACEPVILNVNAVPLVVALFPWLPAIATMKVPL